MSSKVKAKICSHDNDRVKGDTATTTIMRALYMKLNVAATTEIPHMH